MVSLLAAIGFGFFSATGQTPTIDPVPPPEGRLRREQALAKLFEGQRYLWRLQRMQSQAGRANSRRQAKEAFEAAIGLDPSLAEGHTALSQLAVAVPPRDMEEGIRQAGLAVKADPRNIGGRRMLARLYTAKSGLNNGQLDKTFAERARSEWREVAGLDPRNAEAWAFLAAFADAENRTDEQIEALRKWVSAATPSDVAFYEGIIPGSSLTPESAGLKLAGVLIKAEKFDEAAAILSAQVSEDPDNAEAIALLIEIIGSIDGGSAAPTIAALQQAVYANPDNISLIELLARLYSRLGRIDDSLILLRSHIGELARTDASASSRLALALAEIQLERDRYDDAAAALETALKTRQIAPTGPVKAEDKEYVQHVFERLIHVARLADQPQTVRSYIERSRKALGKDDIFADRQMITFLRSRGSNREALVLVRTLRLGRQDDIRLMRLEATLLADLGQVAAGVELIGGSRADRFSDLLFISNLYSRARKGSEAIDSAQRALAAASGSEQRQIAKTTLATALQINGDSAEAERTLRELLAETPGNPMALNNLGYFLTERGVNLEEAVRMIAQAVKVDPRNSSYLDSLGWAYFRLGKLSEAEKYLSDAARLDVDSATIREHLGDLYRQMGQPAKAKAMWESALRLSTDADGRTRLQKKLGR